VLVVTTTVRMVHRVHSHTGHLGESLSLSLVFVEQHTSFHDGLLVSAPARDDAHCGSAVARDGLPGSGGQSHSGLEAVVGVAYNGGVGA